MEAVNADINPAGGMREAVELRQGIQHKIREFSRCHSHDFKLVLSFEDPSLPQQHHAISLVCDAWK